MKLQQLPHDWQVTTQQAIAIQNELAQKVCQQKPKSKVRIIAGVDCAFTRDKQYCIAAVVVWDIAKQQVSEQQIATARLLFPYIPGLLSFREAPAIIAALSKLKTVPDALMCDGQGIAHPRRFGIASHLGVVLQMSSIGCAKSRLIGQYAEPGIDKGCRSALLDKNERIGTVLRTRTGVKPVLISIGNQFDLSSAEEICLACTTRYRLPEPTRLADKLVARAKRELI